MSESNSLGNKGEDLAVEYLRNNGYSILWRNWKWGNKEIDIIAENNEFIVFTEVKTRAEDPLAPPALAVNREKQRAIIWAAEGYLKRYRITKESRFDIITVVKKGEEFEINHMQYAFYPSLR